MSQSLTCFRRVTFEVVAHECPDAARISQMPIDFERPAFERRFPLPEKLAVTMDAPTIAIVFRPVIAEQSEIKKISCLGQKLERREIALVQGTGIGPHPANAMFLKKPNNLRPMPARMAKLDGEAKISRKLPQKIAES